MLLLPLALILSCSTEKQEEIKLRKPVDSIGFATKSYQVESFIKRIEERYADKLKAIEDSNEVNDHTAWKTLIAPHDDYAYVQYLYPAALKNLKARTIFIIGVAHKAKTLNLENKIVFDTYNYWDEPYGKIKISDIRENLMADLDSSCYLLSDSMQGMEHSAEAFLPIMQYYQKDFQIVPILVPYMPFGLMDEIARNLANAIFKIAKKRNLQWGKDYAILISNDAVHYGDQDWGGKNFALFGTDSFGYNKAKQFEYEIINNCLLGGLSIEKIKKFNDYTVQENDYKEYKWTWCGRYSVPFGLLTTLYLQELYHFNLKDRFIAYSTSIENSPLDTSGLNLGFTAPANIHHWVGYTSIAYE